MLWNIFGLPGAEHSYGCTMHLVRFFQYREFPFPRAKRAEGEVQPIKALQGSPEYGEEAWCKVSARSVKSWPKFLATIVMAG